MGCAQWTVLGIGLVAFALGVVSVLAGLRSRRKLAVIEETKTVSAAEAAGSAGPTGRVEISGVAETAGPLIAPASGERCLYYRTLVEQLHIHYEQVPDGYSLRQETWETVEDEKRHVPFLVRDPSGSIEVDPPGAEFVAVQVVDRRPGTPDYEAGDGVTLGEAVGEVVGTITRGMDAYGGLRTSEWIIPVNREVYVLGTLVPSEEAARIARGEGPFIISYKSERHLARRFRLNYVAWLVAALILGGGGAAAAVYAAAFMKR